MKVNYIVSNAFGHALGLVNIFLWNRTWTFNSDAHMLKKGAVFVIVLEVCYYIQSGSLALMVEKFHLSKLLAQVFAMLISTGLNFPGNKRFSF